MKATRTIPGRPVNDAPTTVEMIIKLVGDTLDKSSELDGSAIEAELAHAASALGLLASGGHLRHGELVLTAPGLRLRIDVPVGEKAMSATVNTDPPRGAAKADRWQLHVPVPEALSGIVLSAVKSCEHLTDAAPPDDEPIAESSSLAASIDVGQLRTMRSAR